MNIQDIEVEHGKNIETWVLREHNNLEFQLTRNSQGKHYKVHLVDPLKNLIKESKNMGKREFIIKFLNAEDPQEVFN